MLLPLLAYRRVPQPDYLVPRPRRHRLTVRREGHRPDPAVVPFELLPLLARRRVPQPDYLIKRPRRHRLAVRREGHRGNLAIVPFELLPLSALSVRDA